MAKKSLKSADNPTNTGDKFTGFYTLLTFVVSFVIIYSDVIYTISAHIPYYSNMLIDLIALLLWVAIMLTGLFKNISRRRWRRVISIVVAPIILVSVFWTFSSLGLTKDKFRFECTKGIYLREIPVNKSVSDSPQLMLWDWEQDMTWTEIYFEVLIYDDSDQITLPVNSRSAQWNEAAAQVKSPFKWILHNHTIYVNSLGGHFYLVTGIG